MIKKTVYGFSTLFWSDWDANENGIMLYMSDDISANILATENAP